MKFIVKKFNHYCFSGTALQTFRLRLLEGATAPSPPPPPVSATDETVHKASMITTVISQKYKTLNQNF